MKKQTDFDLDLYNPFTTEEPPSITCVCGQQLYWPATQVSTQRNRPFPTANLSITLRCPACGKDILTMELIDLNRPAT